MRKILIGLLLLVSLMACKPSDGLQQEDGTTSYIQYEQVTLPDGRELECAKWKYANAGGLSCNWQQLEEAVKS